jgi:hypothetical protein
MGYVAQHEISGGFKPASREALDESFEFIFSEGIVFQMIVALGDHELEIGGTGIVGI